jgi:vancomycin resistance protein VanJ
MLRFILSVNIVWSVVCVICYFVSALDPASFWMFSISSLILPVVFLINILFVLFWLVFYWRNVWLPVLTLLIGLHSWSLMISFGEESKARRCVQDPVSIMSFNEPDILCVQENNFFSDDIINNSGLYPYFHYLIQHGAAIYSRFPILDKGIIDFGTKTNSCLWADILVGGKKVRVYSVHLQSNRIVKDVHLITDEQEEKNTEKINLLKNILRKYRNTAIIRTRQAKMLLEHISKTENPCIIAGDFNDTPFSHVYKILSSDRSDSFLECGNGIGTTYVGALPGLRIDFVLGDKDKIQFCSHRVLQTSYSDHNPILVQYIISH